MNGGCLEGGCIYIILYICIYTVYIYGDYINMVMLWDICGIVI